MNNNHVSIDLSQTKPPFPAVAKTSTHAVQIYESDPFLLDEVARFAGRTLGAGDALVMLATPAHRAGLVERLIGGGLDIGRLISLGRYIAVDAAEALDTITVDGLLAPERFHDLVGGLLDRAAASRTDDSARIAVFGELVALLTAAGNCQAAIQLEHLWNDLARTRPFDLFCAYPLHAFARAGDDAALAAICAAHDHVVPAESYTMLVDEPARARAIVGLQQRSVSLISAVEERTRVQLLLSQRDAELAAIVESSADAIVGGMLDGTITSWNFGAERLYGYSAAEMVGTPIARIVPTDRRDELAGILARLERGERISQHETERFRRDGGRIEVSVSLSPIHDQAGQVIGLADIARDITERRAAERRRQELLEVVAHDLRTPLTTVLGYAQLLQRRFGEDPALTAITTQAGRMGRLLADVLETARVETGHQQLRRAPFDLTPLVRDCARQAAVLARDDRIRVEAPESPVIGEWDADRVTQILSNLLDNATKYAPGADIMVQVSQTGDEARVTVSDHGPGIVADHLPRIFDRFYQGGAGSGAVVGVGLGLFISRALAEAHGGRLTVESAPGQGSVFTLVLPLVPFDPAPDGARILGSTEPASSALAPTYG